MHEVIEQMACSEECARHAVVGYHRGLVHDKDCAGMQALTQFETVGLGIAFLPVDGTVDGVGWQARQAAHHLGRPACGCHLPEKKS